MKTASLSLVLLLSLGAACTHAKTAASPRQEERAAQKAEDEPGAGDSKNGSAGDGASDESAADESEKKAERGSASEARRPADPDGTKQARGDGDGKGDAEKKNEDVAPEDIQVATTPQGLLEPGALDKVRDKLGVAKGDSVQGALRRFQRDHDLPATGMLDHETVERLGLSPDEIFERNADER